MVSRRELCVGDGASRAPTGRLLVTQKRPSFFARIHCYESLRLIGRSSTDTDTLAAAALTTTQDPPKALRKLRSMRERRQKNGNATRPGRRWPPLPASRGHSREPVIDTLTLPSSCALGQVVVPTAALPPSEQRAPHVSPLLEEACDRAILCALTSSCPWGRGGRCGRSCTACT